MTELVAPKDIGRNDPCPCGSGKKYKKCHQRIHELEREAEQKTRAISSLIGPDTNPWQLYKVLIQLHEDNLVGMYFELLHELGPMRARYADRSALLMAVDRGDEAIPAAPAYKVVRFRVDGPWTYILLVRAHGDELRYQILTLARAEHDAQGQPRQDTVDGFGLRLWDVEHKVLTRDQVSAPDGDVSLEALGYAWRKPAAA